MLTNTRPHKDLAFRDMMGLKVEDVVKTQWKGSALQLPGEISSRKITNLILEVGLW